MIVHSKIMCNKVHHPHFGNIKYSLVLVIKSALLIFCVFHIWSLCSLKCNCIEHLYLKWLDLFFWKKNSIVCCMAQSSIGYLWFLVDFFDSLSSIFIQWEKKSFDSRGDDRITTFGLRNSFMYYNKFKLNEINMNS